MKIRLKKFMQEIFLEPGGGRTHNLLITSRMRIGLNQRGRLYGWQISREIFPVL